jgi:hypothetical protein
MVLTAKPADICMCTEIGIQLFAAINKIGKYVLHNLVHEITKSVVRRIVSKLIKIGIKKYKLVYVCEKL